MTRSAGWEDHADAVRADAGQLGPQHVPQNIQGSFLLKIEDLWKEHIVS